MKQFFESLFGKNSALAKKPDYWLKIGLLGLAGMVLIIIGSTGNSVRSQQEAVSSKRGIPSGASGQPGAIKQEEKYLADRLKAVLETVEGAGKVEVTVRLAGSTRTEYAVNTTTGKRVTEEKDKSGSNRLITEDNNNGQVVLVRDGQKEDAVVEREEAPRILGVLVVADGAGDPEVKAEIFRAAEVALGVEAHRVLVLPKRFSQESGGTP